LRCEKLNRILEGVSASLKLRANSAGLRELRVSVLALSSTVKTPPGKPVATLRFVAHEFLNKKAFRLGANKKQLP
jgi:hypothetical protein